MPPPPAHDGRELRRGVAAAAAAFVLWGLFPLYFKPLAAVPAVEVIAHRIAWCALALVGWLAWRGELGTVRALLRDWRTTRWLLLSACLLTVNWLAYVWAVLNGHTVEASLGYFINPLLSVLLGRALFGERLSRPQWLAVALAGVGVAWLVAMAGGAPWVAIVVALTWGGYGLVRKVVPVGALPGLTIETLLLLLPALAWLGWQATAGRLAFGGTPVVDLLLAGSGVVTALPLLLFAGGMRRIPYSVAGVLQYLSPTLQFLIGVLVFGEPFTPERAAGFVLIWTGVAVFLSAGWRRVAA